MSENICVRSVVGRFLEHSRAYWFHHRGEEKVYLSSADWMVRNLHRRVEIAFPIENPALRERVIEEGMLPYLKDTRESWNMNSDGSYEPVPRDGTEPVRAQQILLERLAVLGRAASPLDNVSRRKSDRKKKRRRKKKG